MLSAKRHGVSAVSHDKTTTPSHTDHPISHWPASRLEIHRLHTGTHSFIKSQLIAEDDYNESYNDAVTSAIFS